MTSLQYESVYGSWQPIGTLQLYNRHLQDISLSDLQCLAALRKLIGGVLDKCDHYQRTLQTVVGLRMQEESTEHARRIFT